jgi:hypothetical protein
LLPQRDSSAPEFHEFATGVLREIKQFDIEGEAIEARGLQNRAADIETKSLKPALSVPKRRPVARRTSKLNTRPPARVARVDEFQSIRDPERETQCNVDLAICNRLDQFRRLPSGVERSASKNRPIGFRAASNPERTRRLCRDLENSRANALRSGIFQSFTRNRPSRIR